MVRRLAVNLGQARRPGRVSVTGLSADEYRPMSLAQRLGVGRDGVGGGCGPDGHTAAGMMTGIT
ncbi:MAG TPA: hypothetical protein VH092_24930 [Urbifossiella sp.]|nr:hypothetical protein [Urbifossiella sp.]